MFIKVMPILFLILAQFVIAEPLRTAFTYQGHLKQSGTPANGAFDFDFQLFDLQSGGVAIAEPSPLEEVNVVDGIFTVELDFGTAPFAGDQLWLQVGVREGSSPGGHTILLPRQELTVAPYALHAEMVAMGAVGSTEVDSSQVQLRISDSCSAGRYVQAISEDGTVTCIADSIGLTAVTSGDIVDDTITSDDLGSGSVGVDEIDTNAVGSAEIINGSVGSVDIATAAVGSPAIANGGVTTVDLANGAVTFEKHNFGSPTVLASSCGSFVAVAVCPAGNIDTAARCNLVTAGNFCEFDAAQGCTVLSDALDNCGNYDWYFRIN
ncbi:MAG: hypothetical protein QNJ40_10845 [Xanthomonadales bacterium]|nr:hypothetical protein [Xanthomonadales bacterium]